ncbi:MAG: AI-2E family transporter [Proteobacteria bacterium]|nr:AI-2E family transporter [Pseudomonadota bacterium]
MEDFVSAPWLRRLLTATLLAGLGLLGARVIQPFIIPLVWAAILGYVTWSSYQRLLQRCGGRVTLASLLMTAVVSIAVIAPLVWLAVMLRIELLRAYEDLQSMLAAGAQLPPAILKLPWIGEQLRDLAARFAGDPHALGEELRRLADHSFNNVAHVASSISRNLVKLAFTVLTLFFVYRGGARLAAQVARALELVLGARVHNYFDAIGRTVKAVVSGMVLAAALQGILAGLGYWLAGSRAPVFLACLTIVLGIVPFAAPTLWGGVSLWLILDGHTVAGVALGIWGALVIGWIDHFVRPFLISREAQIPFLLVLFGVLGGLAAFGLVGLFAGPVILAVLLAVWREWLSESHQLDQPPPDPPSR